MDYVTHPTLTIGADHIPFRYTPNYYITDEQVATLASLEPDMLSSTDYVAEPGIAPKLGPRTFLFYKHGKLHAARIYRNGKLARLFSV